MGSFFVMSTLDCLQNEYGAFVDKLRCTLRGELVAVFWVEGQEGVKSRRKSDVQNCISDFRASSRLGMGE